MRYKKSLIMRVLLLVILMIAPVCGQQNAPAANKKAITIINTGSTNTPPYTIRITPGGTARVQMETRRFTDSVPRVFMQRLIRDLKAVQPLANLTTGPCFKSVSFGSATYLEYQGESTPDIDCLDNAAGRRIKEDVNNIVQYLNIILVPKDPAK
jgi:hypothetical protein